MRLSSCYISSLKTGAAVGGGPDVWTPASTSGTCANRAVTLLGRWGIPRPPRPLEFFGPVDKKSWRRPWLKTVVLNDLCLPLLSNLFWGFEYRITMTTNNQWRTHMEHRAAPSLCLGSGPGGHLSQNAWDLGNMCKIDGNVQLLGASPLTSVSPLSAIPLGIGP